MRLLDQPSQSLDVGFGANAASKCNRPVCALYDLNVSKPSIRCNNCSQ